MIEFRILGPLQVVRGGRALPLGGLKQRSLLALLLLDRNRVVPRDRLIDALWEDEPPASAANSVQVYVSKLRRLLADEPGNGCDLLTEPPGYVLRIPEGTLDADEFERLLAESKLALARGSFEEAEAALARALALWRGPALVDLAGLGYAQAEIARLENVRLEALEARFEAMLAVGRQAEAVGELQALVGLHPLDERLRAQLMIALYRVGRQAEALESYRAFRALMSDELGLEPGRELRELEQAILRQDPALLPVRVVMTAEQADEPVERRSARLVSAEEHRPVTALSAALVGSTALESRLGSDESSVLAGECLTVMSRAVEEYGGTVAARGDGEISAHFGVSAPHEDDPERAVRAALRILEIAHRYAEDVEAAWGVSELAAKAGVDTGPALEKVADTAASLQDAAEPGAILLGETTAHRLAHRFDLDPLAQVTAAGRAEALTAARVLAAKEHEPASEAMPLVDREEELERLDEIVADLVSGRGRIAILLGEPGIGKSRLLAELRSRAEGRVGWLEGECHSYGGFPCWPFVQILLGWLDAEIDEPEIVLRTKARARLRKLFGDEVEGVLAPLETLMRLRVESPVAATDDGLRDAYLRWLETLAQQRPVIVAVEDTHWADPPARDLGEQLLELTDRAPVALVVTEEPIPGSEGAQLRLRALADYGHRTLELPLGPIPDAAAEELLAGSTGDEIDPATALRLVREAEGNPLYLGELARAYLDGALEPHGRTWTITMGSFELLPPTLENLLVARIDRQPDGPRRLAQIAAAIGRTFPVRVLEAVVGEPVDEPLRALLHAEIVRELRRYPELECAFTHGLMREAVLSTLSAARSRSLYGAIATAYESLYADSLEDHFERLAHYHAQAGDLPRALEYAEQARASD